MDLTRWQPFSDAELRELLDGLVIDDGLWYEPERGDEPLWSLVMSLREELRRRQRQSAATG